MSTDTLQALRRGDLTGVRELRLSGLGLTELPPEILGLAETLEVLDLGHNALTCLPPDFARLKRLRVLFCSGNRFDRLPSVLGDCPALSQVGFRGTGMREVPGEALPPALRWLILTDNAIARLPASLGERPALQKLMLAGNHLSELPSSLAGSAQLELLRLSVNRFRRLPPWLGELPRLAWLAWGANPLDRGIPPPAAPRAAWPDLALGLMLGEGTSGRVHHALWHGRPVALKLFKGGMTSDGLPEREMAACLAAGEHPHLSGGLARLGGHPEGVEGLLMPLLPEGWRVLAGPPSLESCSRDVYDPALRLAPATLLRLVRGIAAAAAHLHARGLLHGDLYAHNILWDGGDGQAVLSDFGAASHLPQGAEGGALRRLEVRAWGLLLGELLDRCENAPAWLRLLEHRCVQPDTAARPGMAEVAAALERAAPG
ncbi:leucine-rich repeat-containing serine/threonine-protein kinase [Roseomonas sp. OT10]|uniref:leucine-rich repeat-containing protein kinase family protein n=1 Tax=Roseomonas cutis TaxID=2897332 RepID=UPI001E637D0E|nr:leucine-rich repeat-containing protein kinase family protein [Roseomonas sp. OT10]UFN48558.1 leucine-rich repeat-containing serine/threonine-protein kinase [Roseomonas sp. OT10]